jgi:GNAT superfamily N-acetyltransferase
VNPFKIEKLARHHPVEDFDCGSFELNRFLVKFALGNQQAHASQTHVGFGQGKVIGFYTLVVGDIDYATAPERMTKGLARHPVPVMVLARLAVDQSWQGKGVGIGLLRDAAQRTLAAADIAGIRALMVHAKDDAARNFYSHFGFAAGFSDPLHLYVLMKDLKALTT